MSNGIDPATKIFGITGYPLSHTYSPIIHNYLFERYGINAVYLVFPSEPRFFSKMTGALKTIGVKGLNVTIPYKTNIIRYCDTLDETAKRIGAVNTVVEKNGHWHGTVTDPEGFVHAIEAVFKDFQFNGKRILVLGAGGASQSVVYASLAHKAAEVVIMNRTFSKVQSLEGRMKKLGFMNCRALKFDKEILSQDNRFDLIVNGTSVGLKKNDPCILDLKHSLKITKIYDLIYNPSLTSFLVEAKRQKLAYSNGLGMLVYQAFASFEKWTGMRPDTLDARTLFRKLKAKRN